MKFVALPLSFIFGVIIGLLFYSFASDPSSQVIAILERSIKHNGSLIICRMDEHTNIKDYLPSNEQGLDVIRTNDSQNAVVLIESGTLIAIKFSTSKTRLPSYGCFERS